MARLAIFDLFDLGLLDFSRLTFDGTNHDYWDIDMDMDMDRK